MNWRIAAWPASTFSAEAPSWASFMKESAVRMLSAVPSVLVNAIERVAPPSAMARTVFVVPKSKPSA